MTASRLRGDRGTTLVDLVVGLALTALMAGLIAALMSATADRAPTDTIATDLGLVADQFSRDVRSASAVSIDVARRGTTLTAHHDGEDVVWELGRRDLTRTAGTGPDRVLVAGIDTARSSIALRDADGMGVDPDDADAVRWCTRLVELTVIVDDDTGFVRATALRTTPTPEACP